MVDRAGEEVVLAEMPTRHAVDSGDLVVELVGQTRMLMDSRVNLVRRFFDLA